jgi:hypothetical protein
MALGDKVDELQRAAATFAERLDNALKALDALYATQREGDRALADFRRDAEREIALLKREVDDWKRWRDDDKREREERSRRLWSFGPNVASALISGIISAAVAYFIARR